MGSNPLEVPLSHWKWSRDREHDGTACPNGGDLMHVIETRVDEAATTPLTKFEGVD